MFKKFKEIITQIVAQLYNLFCKSKSFLYKVITAVILVTAFVSTYLTVLAVTPLVLKTHYYQNDDGHIVIYQEMIHFADKEYYDRLNKIKYTLTTKKDYVHLFERVIVKPEDAEKLNKVIGAGSLKTTIFDDMGLVPEGQNLYITNDDIRADVDSSFLVSRIKKDDRQMTQEELDNIKSLTSNETAITMTQEQKIYFMFLQKAIFKAAIKINGFLTEHDINFNSNKFMDDVILNDRNAVAIDYVLKQEKNVLLTYGAAHYRGLNELLIKNGYKKVAVGHMQAIE